MNSLSARRRRSGRRLRLAPMSAACGALCFAAIHLLLAPTAFAADFSCEDDGEAPGIAAGSDPTEAAFQFLAAQMDRNHRTILVSATPIVSSYGPTNSKVDTNDVQVVSQRDRNGLRIDYKPSGHSGGAGLYFLHPPGNWGESPGRNLSGAEKLTFRACADRTTLAQFSIGGLRQPGLPYADSLERRSTGTVTLQPKWQRLEIPLTGADLSSVIAGFAVMLDRDQGSQARSIWVDDVVIERSHPDGPRLLQSFLSTDCAKGGAAQSAQTYDQALALLAFLARGRPDDMKRADSIARALVEAQRRDRTFRDGRVRNAYQAGDPIDPRTNTASIAGEYNDAAQRYQEDENAAGSDTGNLAWAALALAQAHEHLPTTGDQPYLAASRAIARWIVANTRMNDEFGGFSAGLHGFEQAAGVPAGQSRRTYRSTEHNIDLEVLFGHLATIAGADTQEGHAWAAEAGRARSFVQKMQNDPVSPSHFWTGTGPDSTINKQVIPLDVQAWAVLRSPDPGSASKSLNWALKNCAERGRQDSFDFNCNDGDGAWWEGTAQVATALRWLRRTDEAASLEDRLATAQLKAGPARGALPAASRCGITTGFDMSFASGQVLPLLYPDWPHIGATAWFIFARLGVNPFHLKKRR